nr:MAG TPA: hypothetical protein [Caudoviricetes sp.]
MDIQEIANSYAEGKANEAITKAIAQAYIDGYKDGYKNGKEKAQIECNDAEFVDLGLPSGTLWASDYLKDDSGKICYFIHEDAKNYSLPKTEQWEELKSCCKWILHNYINGGQVQCIGPNGNYISFSATGLMQATSYVNKSCIYMWLEDEVKSTNRNCIKISYDKNCVPTLCRQLTVSFCGFKLPVRLVR